MCIVTGNVEEETVGTAKQLTMIQTGSVCCRDLAGNRETIRDLEPHIVCSTQHDRLDVGTGGCDLVQIDVIHGCGRYGGGAISQAEDD